MASSSSLQLTFPVLLNVYDAFPRLLNHPLHLLGLGFYRSAVEVHGEEYMFTDIRAHPPEPTSRILIGNAGTRGLPLRHSIVVGRTSLTQAQAREQVQDLRDTAGGYANGTYHPRTHNSHHFASAACLRLLPQDSDAPGPTTTLLPWAHRCSSIEPVLGCLTAKAQATAKPGAAAAADTYPVVLNVYEVDPTNPNRRRRSHVFCSSAVEVHGVEYMFSDDGTPGIQSAAPGQYPCYEGLRLKESVLVGRTKKGENAEVAAVAERLAEEHGYGTRGICTYDFFSRNRNEFADHLCVALTGNGIPRWLADVEAIRAALMAEPHWLVTLLVSCCGTSTAEHTSSSAEQRDEGRVA